MWGAGASIIMATLYLAIAALGPVTNYDSGLYHLGAIAYATEYRTIPGLANVYQAFGYNNAQFSLAAFLGNGPWGGVGYRLMNGFLLIALMLDLLLRLRDRRRSVGTTILLVALAAALVPMVSLVDYWVTSPTSDTAVMVLCFVAIAYCADAFTDPKLFSRDAAVAASASIVATAMRPTMAIFALSLLVVLSVFLGRSRRAASRPFVHRVHVAFVLVAGVLLLAVQAIRDYLLSGWLQYPLSVLPFDVPWRALDPVNTRMSTLGFARNPLDYEQAMHGWSWVMPWLRRLPDQWETFEWLALLLFVIVLAVLARRRTPTPGPRSTLVLLMLPSLVALAAWWVASPPSFRFAWGPLFGLLAVPAGWFLWILIGEGRSNRSLRWEWAVSAWSALIIVLVIGNALFRLDWQAATEERQFAVGPFSIAYAVAPVPIPETADRVMPSGLVLRTPTRSDQCWAAYPLCTPLIESPVAARGPSIQDGFVP